MSVSSGLNSLSADRKLISYIPALSGRELTHELLISSGHNIKNVPRSSSGTVNRGYRNCSIIPFVCFLECVPRTLLHSFRLFQLVKLVGAFSPVNHKELSGLETDVNLSPTYSAQKSKEMVSALSPMLTSPVSRSTGGEDNTC